MCKAVRGDALSQRFRFRAPIVGECFKPPALQTSDLPCARVIQQIPQTRATPTFFAGPRKTTKNIDYSSSTSFGKGRFLDSWCSNSCRIPERPPPHTPHSHKPWSTSKGQPEPTTKSCSGVMAHWEPSRLIDSACLEGGCELGRNHASQNLAKLGNLVASVRQAHRLCEHHRSMLAVCKTLQVLLCGRRL